RGDGEAVGRDDAGDCVVGHVNSLAADLDAERQLERRSEARDALGRAAQHDARDLAAAVLRAVEVEGVANLSGDLVDAVLEYLARRGVQARCRRLRRRRLRSRGQLLEAHVPLAGL